MPLTRAATTAARLGRLIPKLERTHAMSVVRVLLHTTLVRNGSTRVPGQETIMDARQAGALAADGRVTILDGDNATAQRMRSAVIEARRAVHGPKWSPGARGVERHTGPSDIRVVTRTPDDRYRLVR